MSADLLEQAKQALPLPKLMDMLGHGDRAKKSSRCPFTRIPARASPSISEAVDRGRGNAMPAAVEVMRWTISPRFAV